MIKENTFFYKVYGLNLASYIILPELPTIILSEDDVIHVSITEGSIPDYIKEEIKKGKRYKFSYNETWFIIEDVAIYYIRDGNSITIQPSQVICAEKLKTFLLGSAFGALLMQRNTVAIHGGSIIIDNKAAIITGNMGAGKSTLTSAFRQKGYHFLADDVSVINNADDGTLFVCPAYPQQKLCGDSAEKLGYDYRKLKLIDSSRNKYAITLHECFINRSVVLGAIFELTIGDVRYVEMEEIFGLEKMMVIFKNIYRVEYTNFTGIHPEYYKNYIQIPQKIKVYRITRPKVGFTVSEQIEVITKALSSENKLIV